MTRSMTAFARQGVETPAGALVWELRSVNHRYLDMSLRLPEELRAIENPVRERIASRLERGKVEANLKLQAAEQGPTLHFDAAAARAVLAAAGEATALASGLAPLSVADVLRWPGVLRAPAPDPESVARAALAALNAALDELVATREREGGRLQQLLEERLAAMRAIVANLAAILPEVMRDYRARVEARLGEVRAQLDPARLEQEMVLYTNRADVTEEMDRLQTHIGEVERVLAGGGQIGRRLDFLMQELNRETNTLASKSVDIRLTNAAVELKVLIEQMREQVQNIE
ncbi:hypothetical protein SVA_0092 [Sulfurifustis variabilis]|uniref:Stress-induced protein n=1 Tax=Sulfurifustis variabilis TaxID=1675686 RepID=A0A1B4V623_9GAMM|nr:YicC/YloC family endoribonuclease [Sulfurifustis variabilis]BAU46674.1 hypothetical protein SVA_0092 [Sulfurifustis variabilis]